MAVLCGDAGRSEPWARASQVFIDAGSEYLRHHALAGTLGTTARTRSDSAAFDIGSYASLLPA